MLNPFTQKWYGCKRTMAL